MTKVVLDACIPHFMRHQFSHVDVETAYFAGLDKLTDSALLDAIEGEFDALITVDGNLTFQQTIAGRSFAVIVLQVVSQSPQSFAALIPEVNRALENISPGQVIVIGP